MDQSKLSANEQTRKISDLLKTADRYVLAGEFDKAFEQVDLVFKIDPDNIYAKAYVKRIDVFKRKYIGDDLSGEKHEVAVPNKNLEQESNVTDADKTKFDGIERDKPDNKLDEDQQRKLVEEIISGEADLLEPNRDQTMVGEQQEERVGEKDPETLKQEENEAQYRKALELLWKTGAVADDDRQKIDHMRSSLGISDERHQEIERSVKLNAYVNAVKEAWRDGYITPNGAAALDELRERYSITIDEHLMIESRIMYELHGMRVKGVVMIIDDDIELVKIIKSILREEGYAPFSAHTPEHGLKILERTQPDLILLDVTFPKPSVSGFTTYEQIRKRSNLQFIPVVFLSGLDEEHIVQVGKKLGADDYITKPCSEQMLVSTIEGKIKRYKEMRKMSE